MAEKTMHVYPSPRLPATEYLAGIGADGFDLPTDEAEELLKRGLVVKNKPKSPDAPADKSED